MPDGLFALTAPRRSGEGEFQALFIGPGSAYTLERSVDLIDWKEIERFQHDTPTRRVIDPSAGTEGTLYYRVARQ